MNLSSKNTANMRVVYKEEKVERNPSHLSFSYCGEGSWGWQGRVQLSMKKEVTYYEI